MLRVCIICATVVRAFVAPALAPSRCTSVWISSSARPKRSVAVMLFDKFGAEAVNVLMYVTTEQHRMRQTETRRRYAQQETRRVGLSEVGTEAIFLGVVHNPENVRNAHGGLALRIVLCGAGGSCFEGCQGKTFRSAARSR